MQDEQLDSQDGACASRDRPGSVLGQREQAQLRTSHGRGTGQEGHGRAEAKAVTEVGRPPPGQMLTIRFVAPKIHKTEI